MHTSVLNLAVAVLMLSCFQEINGHHRIKRAHLDHFNVLLNLYKMNPLKNSRIFKIFSNRMLVPKRASNVSVVKNFDSNESAAKAISNLNQIEKFIQAYNTTNNDSKKPEIEKAQFENDNVENFGIDIVLNNTAKARSFRDFISIITYDMNDTVKESLIKDFNSILTYLESGEIAKIPVTDLERVNNKANVDVSAFVLNTNELPMFNKNEEFTDKGPVSMNKYKLSGHFNDVKSKNCRNTRKKHDERRSFNYNNRHNFVDAAVILRGNK